MKEKAGKTISAILCSLLVLGIGIGAGVAIGYNVFSPNEEEQKLVDEYNTLKDNWLYYNEETDILDLAASGLAEGVAGDDSYTFYTENQEGQGLSTSGDGFGFSSHSYDGGLYLTDVMENSNAFQAGLQKGDILYSVAEGEDTYSFKDHTFSEVSTYLSELAAKGSSHKYVFKGYRGSEEKSWTIAPGSYSENLIGIEETPTSENGNTLLLSVNTFLGTPAEMLNSILNSYEDKVSHLILDLRGNGGGYVSQAAAMAKLFVKKGTLLYKLVDRDGNVIESASQESDPKYTFDKISLIINSRTASASEIFTLAMRAGTDATVYGLTSYGKGIAQNFKTFSDGSVLRYTYAYVYGPERENETMYDEGEDEDDILCIHGKGIIPDVTFSTDYDYLNLTASYSTTSGISESGQNFFLKVINEIDDESYPDSYSKDYHFTDAVKAFGESMAVKYSDDTLADAFDDNGYMLKTLNDKFTKEEYDRYLAYDAELTESVLGA